MKKINFALLGAGRIGQVHASNLFADNRINISYVYDIDKNLAKKTAEKVGAQYTENIEVIENDANVNAVLIASPTDTHVDMLTRFSKANKAILCEKPIALDMQLVNQCYEEIKQLNPFIQLGFHRRYDPSHSALQQAIRNQEIGKIELIIISCRDPEMPPIDYLRVSGGIFKDMMIHDFDMVRFLTNEEPVEISATAGVLIDSRLKEFGDLDTAMVTIKMQSGALAHINNSRRAVYGHDQRIEVHGEKGMLISDNIHPVTLKKFNSQHTEAALPIPHFFIERYQEAYMKELDAFVTALLQQKEPTTNFTDGQRALAMAMAAQESYKTKKTVLVKRDILKI